MEACRIAPIRIKGGYARPKPALDPAGRDAGGPEGVRRN